MNYKLLIVLLFIIVYSCRSKENLNLKSYSQNIIGKNEYEKIYTQAKDSIISWVDNSLNPYGYFKKYNRGYLLDDILCFNKAKDKFIGALLINHKEFENATLDDIWFFYGVKIRDNWYFFNGADITLPRENYQSDTHVPLSFDKLHEIAMREIFSGYLIKDAKGNWQINDKFFDWFTSKAVCPTCVTETDFENNFLQGAALKWKKR